MKKHLVLILFGGLIVLGLLSYAVTYTVQYHEIVIVKQFGKITSVQDGSSEAGIYLKLPWPVQTVEVYDRRIATFETALTQVTTAGKQPVNVSVSCSWRIDDPRKFNRVLGRMDAVDRELRSFLGEFVQEEVRKHPMSDFVNVDKTEMQQESIADEIERRLTTVALEKYGLKIVRVGLKTFGVSQQIAQTIIEAEKKEREAAANRYKSEGQALATTIKTRAATAYRNIMNFATFWASDIRTQGERAALDYYDVFAGREDFAIFLWSLEAMRKELSGDTILIMDSRWMPAMRMFYQGPIRANVGNTSALPPLPPLPPVGRAAPQPAGDGRRGS